MYIGFFTKGIELSFFRDILDFCQIHDVNIYWRIAAIELDLVGKNLIPASKLTSDVYIKLVFDFSFVELLSRVSEYLSV